MQQLPGDIIIVIRHKARPGAAGRTTEALAGSSYFMGPHACASARAPVQKPSKPYLAFWFSTKKLLRRALTGTTARGH